MDACPCCCIDGSNNESSDSRSLNDSPFALQNLLAVGAVVEDLTELGCFRYAEHDRAEDGWSSCTSIYADIPTHTSECLDFLETQEYIRVTHMRTASKAILRIYLVPLDLSGVQGRLRLENRKDHTRLEAARYLANLLPKLDRRPQVWSGSIEELSGCALPVLNLTSDYRHLAEIYGSVPSPHPIASDLDQLAHSFIDYEDDLDFVGLRSTLHKYQRRSVATMLFKETNAQPLANPLYVKMSSVDQQKTFYLQPGTMEVLQHPPLVDPCKGGILCEELGTGKTVICLALILATLNQLPKPEPSISEVPEVLTPLSVLHFSGDSRLGRQSGIKYRGIPNSSPRVPSLREMLLDQQSRAASSHAMDNVLPGDMAQALPHNQPFYLVHPESFVEARRGERTAQRTTPPRKVYLTSATLIVLPLTLMDQWDREINKHCDMDLRVLSIRGNDPLPSAKELASMYDIVLITTNRISLERSKPRPSPSKLPKLCNCPFYSKSIRVPVCSCKESSQVSPLLQIRWKRLIVDEGNNTSSKNTSLVDFYCLLNVGARWTVTGTPTRNLLGLSFGQHSVESELPMESNGEGISLDSAELSSSTEPEDVSTDDVEAAGAQKMVWGKAQRLDITNLMSMIENFLGFKPLGGRTVDTHVKDPLFNRGGPLPGAIQVLEQVMSFVMIRHRIEDVEKEVKLPPMRHDFVLLDMDPLAIKTYNALQAGFAINIVESDRTDQDYIFHRDNTEHVQTAIKNMSQILFWMTDDEMFNADQILRTLPGRIMKMQREGRAESDIDLIWNAYGHLMNAALDPLWRYVQNHEDPVYKSMGIPKSVFNTWSRIPDRLVDTQHTHFDISNDLEAAVLEGTSQANDYIQQDRLIAMRDEIKKRPLANEGALVLKGQEVSERDQIMQSIIRDKYDKKSKKEGKEDTKKKPGWHSQTKAAAVQEVKSAQQQSSDWERLKLLLAKEAEGHLSAPDGMEMGLGARRFLARSILAGVRVQGCSSTKLSYIINEVLRYSETEKFLIFSDSELTLAFIRDALHLVEVESLLFSTQNLNPKQREQMVLTFETSSRFRVLLMALKHGARGLNIISASRIIFCEPVWQADIESQAIKRAHRIGQTRSITVKTLAIRNTHEHAMVGRRHEKKDGKQAKLVEDVKLREFIENVKFIEDQPSLLQPLDLPLLKLPPEETNEKHTNVVESPSGPPGILRKPGYSEEAHNTRPIKRARFADSPKPQASTSPPRLSVKVENTLKDENEPPKIILSLPPRKRVRIADPQGEPAQKRVRIESPA